MVALLLANGADPEDPVSRSTLGKTSPLQLACLYNQPQMVAMLIEAGADVNGKDVNYLVVPSMTQCLLPMRKVVFKFPGQEAPGRYYLRHTGGDPPIMIAAVDHLPEVLKVLPEKGADVNNTGIGGQTALYRAQIYARVGSQGIAVYDYCGKPRHWWESKFCDDYIRLVCYRWWAPRVVEVLEKHGAVALS
jgi:hypothetical protein